MLTTTRYLTLRLTYAVLTPIVKQKDVIVLVVYLELATLSRET